MYVQKEYRELIRETIDYLLSEWDLPPPPTPKKPLFSPPPKKPSSPLPKPEVKAPLQPKKRSPPPREQAKDERGKWTLHPMPLPERGKNRYEACFSSLPLQIPIYFLCEESEPELQLFLEGVARATTQRIGPATVVSWETSKHLLKERNAALLVVPLTIATSLLPNAEPHLLSTWEGKTLLPLAPLSTYTSNPDAKRFLWNQLQTVRIPNTPQSS
ncbi:MAG: hypothetical protein K940chlam9_01203 [Chlamydiae bacterium]|nr:hypothetical protein [Chlamydiota bacterium]